MTRHRTKQTVKTYSFFVCTLCLVILAVGSVFAGGIDNNHNFSAEYVRTLNRNAATDSADAVVYNPAGVVRMEDGFRINLAGQYIFKDYRHTYGGTEYDTDEPDIVPGLFCLHKKDRWAAFAAFTMPCGGGTVDYRDGSKTTLTIAQGIISAYPTLYDGSITSQRMEAESYYYALTAGGAYALNDKLSVSFGIRHVDAQIKRKGSATLGRTALGMGAGVPETLILDYEETDSGWAGILGLNLMLTEDLNIALRYETKTSLDLETKEKEDNIDLITNSSRKRRDLPALLGLGVSYNITSRLRGEADVTYYFNKDAKWDDDSLTSADETDKSNGYDAGIALEYAVSAGLICSLGFMVTETGISPDNMSIEAPQLDAKTLAGGICYELMSNLNLNVGILKTFYDDETMADGTRLEKDITILAVGFDYKL